MKDQIKEIIDDYQAEKLDRRGFLTKMIALTGTYAAAHLLLEQTGLAQTYFTNSAIGLRFQSLSKIKFS